MRTRAPHHLVAALVALAACEPPSVPDTDTSAAAVIYGSDDRVDWYAAPPGWQQIIGDALVALVDPGQVDQTNPNDVQLRSGTLGADLRLCAGQRFYDQPDPGMCSATLIDDDLVLTAGHCLDSNRVASCASYRYVFNFYMTGAGRLQTITRDDVYSCRAVAVRQLVDNQAGSHDFAIVQLDRPATPRHQPVPVRAALAGLPQGSGVNLLGFPEGLPAKFAPGASVMVPRAQTLDFFEANIDSFEGNSGSGVFDNQGRVVGIAVSGQSDWTVRGNCQVANTLPNDGSQGLEQISYAADAIRALCQANWPSPRLCGTSACGDGRCDTAELGACPQDCAVLDGGVPPDAGFGPDAGTPPDAGPRPDAGTSPDAGPRRDGGLGDGGAGRDGGAADGGEVTRPDAAALDASEETRSDGGEGDAQPRPPTLETVHGGGCGCAATAAAGPSGAGSALLAGLGLLVARRRRRGRG